MIMVRSDARAIIILLGLLLSALLTPGCAERRPSPAEDRGQRRQRSESTSTRNDWLVNADTTTDSTKPDTAIATASRNITVQSPKGDSEIAGNSFLLKGTARTFENALSYRLTASNGTVLATGQLTSVGQMGSFNPYTTRVAYRPGYHGTALLEVFQHSARDGAEIDKVSIPIRIAGDAGSDEMVLNVYFTKADRARTHDCRQVFPLSRSTPRTVAIAEVALNALVDGPTQAEHKLGYETAIPTGTKLESIAIAQGRATAEFSAELGRLSDACDLTAARAQIEQTLRQFPTVKSVTISIRGKKQGLQP